MFRELHFGSGYSGAEQRTGSGCCVLRHRVELASELTEAGQQVLVAVYLQLP
jgi:hypothetical protein